jgi:SAM-dependent methyltransferase
MTTSAAQQRYWLGDSPPEVDHLLAQAEFLAPDAAGLLDCIGVAPGASVIDIGCGVLGILSQLRSRVGHGGRVAGLDIEPRLLAVAGQLSAQHGLAVETVSADAASTGLQSGSFDLVHERMLLLNVTSPRDIVTRNDPAHPARRRRRTPGARQRGLGHRPTPSRLGDAADRGHRSLPPDRPGLPYRPARRAPAA